MDNYEDIEENVYNILNRCSPIQSFIWESNDATHITMLGDAIYDSLLFNEPRIKIINIEISESIEDNQIIAHIEYMLIITNARSKIVYQFFNNEGTNI